MYFPLGVAQPLSDVNVNIGDSSVEVSWSYDNSRTVNPVPARYFVATVTQDGMQIGTPFMLNVTTTSITIPGSLLQAESMYTVSVIVRNLQGDSEAVTESITLPVDFNFNNAIGKLCILLKVENLLSMHVCLILIQQLLCHIRWVSLLSCLLLC